MSGFIASGLRRHLFLATEAAKKGVATVTNRHHPLLQVKGIVFPPQQLQKGRDVYSSDLELNIKAANETVVALKAQEVRIGRECECTARHLERYFQERDSFTGGGGASNKGANRS